MSRDLHADMIVEKNRLYSDQPLIHLLILELDDTTTWRFAVYPEDVEFDGETYTAIPAVVDSVEEDPSRLGGMRIHVANADRVVSAALENHQLVGRDVTVRLVSADHLATAACKYDATYRIDRVHTTDDTATFELGNENLMALALPRHRFMRGKCRFRYRGDRCRYPGDEFGATTRQSFMDDRATGPWEKRDGWWILNPQAAAVADADETNDGCLTLTTPAVTVANEWRIWDTFFGGSFVFKPLSGDFDVNVYYITDPTTNPHRSAANMMVRSVADEDDWVALHWLHYVARGPSELHYASTVDGATTYEQIAPSTICPTMPHYGRIARIGDQLSFYWRAAEADAWTSHITITRADLLGEVHVGLSAAASESGTGTAEQLFGYIRFSRGGLASCDYTMNGPDGCAAHNNTRNYGGADGIPSGRIYV